MRLLYKIAARICNFFIFTLLFCLYFLPRFPSSRSRSLIIFNSSSKLCRQHLPCIIHNHPEWLQNLSNGRTPFGLVSSLLQPHLWLRKHDILRPLVSVALVTAEASHIQPNRHLRLLEATIAGALSLPTYTIHAFSNFASAYSTYASAYMSIY